MFGLFQNIGDLSERKSQIPGGFDKSHSHGVGRLVKLVIVLQIAGRF